MFLLCLIVCVAFPTSGITAKTEEIDRGALIVSFHQMDAVFESLNRAIANLEWQTLKNYSIVSPEMYARIVQVKFKRRNQWCAKLIDLRNNGVFANKKLFRFLCNGPRYTNESARKIAVIDAYLSSVYASAKICKIENYAEKCYNNESDLTKLMATSRREKELRWVWTTWRNRMSHTRELFSHLIDLENAAARNNGYADIGEYWREEFEISNLESVLEEMYRQVEPLYRLIHAVVRYRLAKFYPDVVDTSSPIPAHLLGNLWSQNWEALIDIVLSNYTLIMPNIIDSMNQHNYNVTMMVKQTEDFYVSLGFPPLTSKFWKNSVFEHKMNNQSSCHATAVNMYKKDDFRMFACLEAKPQDFNIIYHEIGHIQYYMAYQNQPFFLKNGINTAFHESIGDAIAYGATSVQHMQRLKLINNKFLLRDNFPKNNLRSSTYAEDLLETAVLLRRALLKIPQLPNALIIEKWRWSIFSGKTKSSKYNALWWDLHRRYMGIMPPSPRSEKYFDPAAKFHIAHNIPYAGYFLGNILQVQLFQGLCDASSGERVNSALSNISLHRCDIYGSKNAGRLLRSVMELGSNINWRYALQVITGHSEYRVEPFLAYYKPVREWLEQQIEHYKIPVGWD